MVKYSHDPNKFEIIISGCIIFFSSLFTGIILDKIIDTHGIPLLTIIVLFIILSIAFIIGIQSIFNIFYSKWTKDKS